MHREIKDVCCTKRAPQIHLSKLHIFFLNWVMGIDCIMEESSPLLWNCRQGSSWLSSFRNRLWALFLEKVILWNHSIVVVITCSDSATGAEQRKNKLSNRKNVRRTPSKWKPMVSSENKFAYIQYSAGNHCRNKQKKKSKMLNLNSSVHFLRFQMNYTYTCSQIQQWQPIFRLSEIMSLLIIFLPHAEIYL